MAKSNKDKYYTVKNQTLSDRLYKARKAKGMSQDSVKANINKKLASQDKKIEEKGSITRNSISNYEMGKRMPKADILGLLADEYGVTTDYLLGRDSVKGVTPTEILGYIQEELKLSNSSINVIKQLSKPKGTPLFEVPTKRLIAFEKFINCKEFGPLIDSIGDYIFSLYNDDDDKLFDLFKLERFFIKVIDEIAEGEK